MELFYNSKIGKIEPIDIKYKSIEEIDAENALLEEQSVSADTETISATTSNQ